MGKESKLKTILKKAKHALALLVIVGSVLTASAQPAQAITVIDPVNIAKEAAQWILDNYQWTLGQIQAAASAVADALGKLLQTQASAQIADTQSINARTNAQFQILGQAQVDLQRPSNYSACHIMQASAMSSLNETADDALAEAFTLANRRGLADAVINSQVMLNRCNLGFAPATNQNDDEYSLWRSLGCQSVQGGIHEHQDEDISAVLEPREYLVPSNFPIQLAAGNFVMTPVPTDNKYWPFVAAYTFCQSLTPRQNPATKISQNGPPTLEVLNYGSGHTRSEGSSSAAAKCFKSLAIRMQFDMTTTIWKAGNPRTGLGPSPYLPNGIQTRHDEQVAQCEEEFTGGHLDQGQMQDCATNGRSELQAIHDKKWANAQASNATGLGAHKFEDESNVVNQNAINEGQWTEKRDQEEDSLVNAINASNNAGGPPASGPLSTPTR